MMIISSDDTRVNVKIGNKIHENMTLSDLYNFFYNCLYNIKDLMDPREAIAVIDTSIYFACDPDENLFSAKVYQTCEGDERWMIFMADDNEGYALYVNPDTHKAELAWYSSSLDDPISEEKEEELRTCYVPIEYL